MGAAALRRGARALIVSLACLTAMVSTARAQVDQLPKDVTDAPAALSAAQVTALKTYADKYLKMLADSADKPASDPAGETARRSLIEPLTRSSVTPSFRLEYSKAIAEQVRTLSKSPTQGTAINALVIAGDLATEAAVDIAESQLSAKDDGIRFIAVAALRRTFEAVALTAPAVNPQRLESTITKLADALAKETNPEVVLALTKTIIAALKVDRAGHEALRSKAAIALSDSLGARLRELSGAIPEKQTHSSLVLAATELRDALGIAGRIDASAAKAAAGFAGDLLVNLSKVVNKGGLEATPADEKNPQRSIAVQIAQLAEQIVTLAQTKLGGAPVETQLANRLRAGSVNDDASFTIDAAKVTERLAKPPFDLKADRFK